MRLVLLVASLACITACSGSAASSSSSSSSTSSSSSSGGSSSSSSSSGMPDAGPVQSAVECVPQATLNIWNPIAADLQMPRDRGKVLGCVKTASYTAAQVSADTNVSDHGYTSPYGLNAYIIQYATESPPGTPRRVAASVGIPTGTSGPVTLVSVNHGTSGMGPLCGPTRNPGVVDYMAAPIIAHGYAVVATDYVGMGVEEGLHPYLVGVSEAAAILDALRAVRSLHNAEVDASTQLDGRVFQLGHSQGGHASLFAHQFHDASVGMELLGSVSFAPGLGSLQGAPLYIGNGARATDFVTAYVLMVLLGTASYHGRTDYGTWLTPTAANQVPVLMHDQCANTTFGAVETNWPTQADLYTAAFRAKVNACPTDGSACPAFEPWDSELRAELPGDFASDVPVLILQGTADTTVDPRTTACIRDRLLARGTDVQTCSYAGRTHDSVVFDAMDAALQWMQERKQGTTPQVCTTMLQAQCL